MVRRAYLFAEKAHKHQKRTSGEPFFTHLVGVSDILQKIGADDETLAAALLHDSIEDTPVTAKQLTKKFGKTVTALVEGVTKVRRLENRMDKRERSMHSIRKMFQAMGSDMRVLFIKLADRLHNMRTIGSLKKEKRMRIAHETEDIYCPLANLLGMRAWYQELSDLSFQVLDPTAYDLIQSKLTQGMETQWKGLQRWKERLELFLREAGWTNFKVELRQRDLRKIQEAMQEPLTSLQYIETFFALHVLIPDLESCYDCMGNIHQFSSPLPNHIEDYIAVPKVNGYEALHTTVLTTRGHPISIVISTQSMDREALLGAGMIFKRKARTAAALPAWIETLLSLESTEKDLRSFFRMIQSDIFGERCRVRVQVKKKNTYVDLPYHASALDVAYYADPRLAAHAVRATVNGKPVSLKYRMQDGDGFVFVIHPSQERSAEEIYFLYTSLGQKLLMKQLEKRKPRVLQAEGSQLLDNVFTIAMDPFFSIQWRKTVRSKAGLHAGALEDIGKGMTDPFLQLEAHCVPEDCLLLNPRCFLIASRMAPQPHTHFVLRTTVEELRNEPIIGVQVAPDVLEVCSQRTLQESAASRLTKELVPLTLLPEPAAFPFVFALQWHYASDSNPLEMISTLQSMLDTPVKLLRFDQSSITLAFHTDRLRTLQIAYEYLFGNPSVSHLLRITPHAHA